MSTSKITKADALAYHEKGRPGKLEVVPTKPYRTQRDLALAYSPGVAEPCLEIKDNPNDIYKYTGTGNLVGVITNGTAVLGLGNIGAQAGKPVMEGKGLLFKVFADIDVFDIEINETDPEKFITAVKAIAPTFGGINLEDIKAPECFEIEKRLKEELNIPVMHDDQHGTAIISAAGLLNSLIINKKKIENIKIVVNGAGAAAVSCTRLYISLGARRENIVMCDSKGVINTKRTNLTEQKKEFVTNRDIDTLKEAMFGADMFLGLSVADILDDEMVMSMAKDPIIFALANPNPEISYEKATQLRNDVIMATGRSDYPNQINNVLGFPYIFRGALDVRATAINEEMKIACVYAISEIAREVVPDSVNIAYNERNISFGRNYIVPKAVDPRLISKVATAVAKAAIESGVARIKIKDWEKYQKTLNAKLGIENELLRTLFNKAKTNPRKVVFTDGDQYNVIKAASIAIADKIAYPILLGNKNDIIAIASENDIDINGIEIIDNISFEFKEQREKYAKKLSDMRQRKGLTLVDAQERMHNKIYFASMMVSEGDADAMITGYSIKYYSAIRIIDEVIGKAKNKVDYTGVSIMMTKNGPLFLADTTNEQDNNIDNLITSTTCTAELVNRFGITPHIALLSHSNFGAIKEGTPAMVHDTVTKLHKLHPNLIVDGEISLDFALNPKKRDQNFPFSKLNGKHVNTLIFPTLEAARSSYKILKEVADIETIGPVLVGAAKPVHIVQQKASVRDILNITAMVVVDAQQ